VGDPSFERSATFAELTSSNETGLVAVDQTLDLPPGVGDPLVEPHQLGLGQIRTVKPCALMLALPAFSGELGGFEQRFDLLPDKVVEVWRIDLWRWTAHGSSGANVIDAAGAVVVRVATVGVGDHALATHATGDQAAQEVLPFAPEVAA
jgi:hypothetical protein